MANFSALKTAIQNAIKQNGNEEITGNVLQQILLSIVSTMGDGAINTIEQNLSSETLARQNADNTLQQNINSEAGARQGADSTLQSHINTEALMRGNADTQLQNAINAIKADIDNGYVYAGIATPSSTPVSGKVFYIATAAGMYTNFGGQVLTQGINILRFNGSAWSNQQLIGIDNVPTAGSQNLVTSGGVKGEIEVLTMGTIGESFSLKNNIYTPVEIKSSGIYTIVNNSALSANVYISPGESSTGQYNVGTITSGGSKTFTSDGDYNYFRIYVPSGSVTETVYNLIFYKKDSLTEKIDVLQNKANGNDNEIKKLEFDGLNAIDIWPSVNFNDSKFLFYYNGGIVLGNSSNANRVCIVDNIGIFDKLRFASSANIGGSSAYQNYKVRYAFVNIYGSVISASETGSSFAYKVDEIPVPNGAVKIYFQYRTDDTDNQYFIYGIVDTRKISNITSNVSYTPKYYLVVKDGKHKLVSTSAEYCNVGVVDIEKYNSVFFRAYYINVGSNANRAVYAFTNSIGEAILCSGVGGNNATTGNYHIRVPKGAKYLYLMYNSNSDDGIFVYGVSDNTIMTDSRVEKLENQTPFNVENYKIQDYMTVQYDNTDYDYTEEPQMNLQSDDWDESPSIAIDTLVKTNATRSLMVSDNALFNNAEFINLDNASPVYTLRNLLPMKRLYYKVLIDEQIVNYGEIHTSGSVRFLHIAAVDGFNKSYIPNVRDIGGWKTSDGRHLRYGLLARGYELNKTVSGNVVNNVSADGIAELLRLGFRGELDLRGGYNSGPLDYFTSSSISQWFYHLNIYTTQSSFVNSMSNAIRALLAYLRKGIGTYVHCQGGCDRTGVFCAVIEGLCGVSENDINKDYEMSQRQRNREYYSIYAGIPERDSYDGDFRFAMEYIKGLKKYNGGIYTKVRSYKDSKVIINDVVYIRDGTSTSNDVKYCKWINNSTSLYTTDIYPEENSIVYNSSFEDSGLSVTSTAYYYYYDTMTTVSSYTPVPITDASLISELDALPIPTLQEQFRTLMQLGTNGLTNEEIDELVIRMTV